jgi:hypothetical protein
MSHRCRLCSLKKGGVPGVLCLLGPWRWLDEDWIIMAMFLLRGHGSGLTNSGVVMSSWPW